jgi:hypothetical protein
MLGRQRGAVFVELGERGSLLVVLRRCLNVQGVDTWSMQM